MIDSTTFICQIFNTYVGADACALTVTAYHRRVVIQYMQKCFITWAETHEAMKPHNPKSTNT